MFNESSAERRAQSEEREREREREREGESTKERESIQRYLLFVVLDAQDAVFGRFWFPNDSHDVVFQFP
jgi:hypothetical protein